jgi:ABC-type multidrug transport system fused ATPase/permease subunit
MARGESSRSSAPALADLLGDSKASIAALAGASLLSGLAESGVLAIVAQVAARLTSGSRHVAGHLGPIHLHTSIDILLLVAVALALIRLALQLPTSLIPARISASVQASLRAGLLAAFTSASWSAQAADREGRFQELMGSQINQCSQSAIQATSLVTNAGAACILLASSIALNPVAAGIVAGVSACLFVALRPLSATGKRAARELSRAQLAHASGVSEASRLAQETHVFGAVAAQREHIGVLIDEARRHFLRTQFIQRILPGIYQSLVYILLVLGLLAVDRFVTGGLASLGAVVLLLVRVASYGNSMQNSYQSLRQSLPYVSNVREAEAAYRDSAPARGRTPLTTIETVAFDDVSFGYGRQPEALEHISFTAHDGEAIGIAGPSGSGKSTIAQLLLQLRTPTSGRYLVNGMPASEYAEADWGRLVAFVPQTPHLIHASVTDNIRYYRELSQPDVERAARLAGIHADILSWPRGYETIVGPRADAVSGGQAQRICIARALVGRPKMLVLDEPTSAVDLTSERLIQQSLQALKGEVTLFIIAHRISTLEMCDRVMVVLEGRLDALEPFSRIRERNDYYAAVTAQANQSGPAIAARPVAGGSSALS